MTASPIEKGSQKNLYTHKKNIQWNTTHGEGIGSGYHPGADLGGWIGLLAAQLLEKQKFEKKI